MADQNLIWYWTGLNSIILTYNAWLKPDQLPNRLKLKLFNISCQIKTRSNIELAQTQSVWPITTDQNQIWYQPVSSSRLKFLGIIGEVLWCSYVFTVTYLLLLFFSDLFFCNCKGCTAENCSEEASRFRKRNVKPINKLIGSTKWLWITIPMNATRQLFSLKTLNCYDIG